MNVNFYYVQEGSTMPTTYVTGAIYFDANTNDLYRAKSTTEIESFGRSSKGLSLEYDNTTYSEEVATIPNGKFSQITNAVSTVFIPFSEDVSLNLLEITNSSSENKDFAVYYGDFEESIAVESNTTIRILIIGYGEINCSFIPLKSYYSYDSSINNSSKNAPQTKAVKSYVDTTINGVFSYDATTKTLSITTLNTE